MLPVTYTKPSEKLNAPIPENSISTTDNFDFLTDVFK